MTKLSVCIPVEPGMAPPEFLVERLLARADAPIELVVRGFDDAVETALAQIAASDKRLVILPPADQQWSVAMLWNDLGRQSCGDWLTIVSPEDMIEPDLDALLADIETRYPDVDALGWSAFPIDRNASPSLPATVAVSMLHHVTQMEKTQLLQAFFQWEGAQRVPRMPFGLYHGAIKRSLFDTILAADGPASWLTVVPQYEWSAKVLVFANALALSSRQLSAIDVRPFRMVNVPSALEGFPFNARLGLTAAIAEVQARVLAELGSQWGGFNEHFVTACMYDCAMEHDRALFPGKRQGYFEAIRRMPDGANLVRSFQPQYMASLPPDFRRGKFDHTLLVDRFIGKARTAQDFYMIMRSMLAPVAIITGHPELLAVDQANKGLSAA